MSHVSPGLVWFENPSGKECFFLVIFCVCRLFNGVMMSDKDRKISCCGDAFDVFKSDLKFNIRRNWVKTKKLKAVMFDVDSLRRGAGVNVQDDNGYTPLHHACLHGRKEIVRLLLAADASPCVVDKKAATPLHLAAFKGDSDVVAMLLAHNNPPVNIDQLTSDHETALLIAAHFGYVDVVAQLMAKGADVTIENNNGESALDLAAQYGRLETVQHLLRVRPELVDQYYLPAYKQWIFTSTPLHRASKHGRKEVVAALIKAGVDPNVRTANGTALHEAVCFGKHSVVRVLLDNGADIDARDSQGKTVYDLLADYSEEATRRVRRALKDYENRRNQRSAYESDDDLLPPFPVPGPDHSPTGYHHANITCNEKSKLCAKNDAIVTNMNPPDADYINVQFLIPPQSNSTVSLSDLQPTVDEYDNSEIYANDHSENVYVNVDVARKVSDASIVTKNVFMNELQAALKKQKDSKSSPKLKSKCYHGNLPDDEKVKMSECIVKYSENESFSINSKVMDKNDKTAHLYMNSKDDQYLQMTGKNESNSHLDMGSKENKYLQMGDKNTQSCMNKEVNDDIKMGGKIENNVIDDTGKYLHITGTVNNSLSKDDKYDTYLNMDGNYDPFRRRLLSEALPKIRRPDCFGNVSDVYVSMDSNGDRRSIPNSIRPTIKSIHFRGDKGCIFEGKDYWYVYQVSPNAVDGSPFVKKKEKIDSETCFCHEMYSESKIKQKVGVNASQFFSCEDLYVDLNNDNKVMVKNDIAQEFIYQDFNDPTPEESDDSNRSNIFEWKKKLSQFKSLVFDWQ